MLFNGNFTKRVIIYVSSAHTRVGEVGAGGAPGTRAEIPFQILVQTLVSEAVPLQPMEVHGGVELPLQPVEEPTLDQVDAARRL